MLMMEPFFKKKPHPHVHAARRASSLTLGTLSWSTRPFFDKAARNFETGNHEHMRDDQRRTPLYYAAIRSRLQKAAGELTVLDLGTGPFALLALEAARCGAKKVYAIEADPLSAEKAREAVSVAGFSDVVEVVEGISTQVTLPEKVDVLVSETVGSIASEEGLYSTMADAHARHVARPTEQGSWIPHRIQTLGAPCAYALHHGLGHPSFQFVSWKDAIDGPPRPECDDATLWLLARPQLLEDVRLTHPADLLSTGTHQLTPSPVTFTVDSTRLATADAELSTGLVAEGAAAADAEAFARLAARCLSGVAMWPRLELDAEVVIDARGPGGGHAESSWPLLLPLLGEQPLAVSPGASLTVSLAVELSEVVEAPPRYSMRYSMRYLLDAVVAELAAPLADADATPLAPPSFELLHRLSAPLRRLRIRGVLRRKERAAETSEKRAALRRQAWWRYRGKKPPVIRRKGLIDGGESCSQ